MGLLEMTFRPVTTAFGWFVSLLTGRSPFSIPSGVPWCRKPRTICEIIEPRQEQVAHSVFRASYIMSPHHADARGQVLGGEVMKLIDVVAGIAARKHTTKPCVTISVDRVIFLCPASVGDILHLSVSVNRSWGSSLETGVRVIKEDFRTGNQTYACHAYLTFVARPTKVLGTFEKCCDFMLFRQPAVIKVQVPAVLPQTILEQKRYLLAGRRRGHRMQESGEWNELLDHFKKYVSSLNYPSDLNRGSQQATDEELADIEKEIIADGYLRKDKDVRVEDGMVVAEVLDNMDPIKIPLAEIEKLLADRGSGVFRRIAMPVTQQPRPHAQQGDEHAEWPSSQAVQAESTLATTVWIVRPQHCNSMGVLFGGTLMRWLEEVAMLSARHISSVTWVTAAIDSMTLRASAQPGHVVKLRAVAVKTWDSSAEVYCIAKAETRDGKELFISDAFISLVAIDHESSRPVRRPLKQVHTSNIWAKNIGDKSDLRRQERLSDKAMLQKVYT